MDNYALCPCGSGKKVKFCCHTIIGEMEKVERLQENNQPRMALQILEKLSVEHSHNPWVVTRMAVSYLNDGQPAAARTVLLAFLRTKPDHPLANALHAMSVLAVDGLPAAKKAIHRAFRFSIASDPALCGMLAGALADFYEDEERSMAARQHYLLLLRLSNEEERKRAILDLLDLESDVAVAYPLRGNQITPALNPSEAILEGVTRALRLGAVGCWEDAAATLTPLVELEPSAELWHQTALFRAWDGNDLQAAEAFHQAASRYTDRETAIECETLAQLLERQNPDSIVRATVERFEIDSVARVLSQLDELKCLSRFRADAGTPALWGATAMYLVMDQEVAPDHDWTQATVDQLPTVKGRLYIYDQVGEGAERVSPRVVLISKTREDFDQARASLTPVLGTLESIPVDEAGIMHGQHRDDQFLSPELRFPSAITTARFIELLSEHERRQAARWLDHPQIALGGQSPRQAAADPANSVRVSAALNLLDITWEKSGRRLDTTALRQELNLPEPEVLQVASEDKAGQLSNLQLRRLDFKSLPDSQYEAVVQRCVMSGDTTLGIRALTSALDDGRNALQPEERAQASRRLADLLHKSRQPQRAIQRLDQALAELPAGPNRFAEEAGLKFAKMIPLMLIRDEPAVHDLARELLGYYAAKLPALREPLESLLTTEKFEIPRITELGAPGSPAPGHSLWTPDQEPAAAPSGGLWLPG